MTAEIMGKGKCISGLIIIGNQDKNTPHEWRVIIKENLLANTSDISVKYNNYSNRAKFGGLET